MGTQRWVGFVFFGCLWGALATAGCAVEVGDGTPTDEGVASDETVSTASEALVGGWATGPYTWSQSSSVPRKLAAIAGNVCVLTRLTGKFEGRGEQVKVTDDGTNWVLTGASHQAGVAGEAFCFPRAKFKGIDSNTRISSEYERFGPGAPHACGQSSQSEMYASDAFAFLSGLEGALHGGAEYVLVQQALSKDVLSYVEASSCADGGIIAFARNFRVGTRTARLARFQGRNVIGDANDVPEFTAGGYASSGVAVMAPTSDAMCAFTRIEGKFAGGGEWVQIRPEMIDGVERWVLRTGRGGGSDYVRAGARCFTRFQAEGLLGPYPGTSGSGIGTPL